MDPWSHWQHVLGSPKLILAPMVDHSELPWRMLSRKLGCQLAYTPMFHAANFATQRKYRQKNFSTCPLDRPLIVQFCANNPDTFVEAAKHVDSQCDGIDLNLGCPQEIAKRGHYGAFLQDDWALINELVSRLRNNLDSNLSVSCKIRRFEDLEKTVQYARILEKAGCSFVGIHARTREQRGCRTGAADWTYIKAVKSSLMIPVIANGNIQSLKDAEDCTYETGADAVMSAEGNLYNPALFLGVHRPAWVLAQEYLNLVNEYPIPAGMAKSHIFKLFHRCVALEENFELRCKLGGATTIDELTEVVNLFKVKYSNSADPNSEPLDIPITVLPVPPYYCQPRYRYEITTEANFPQGVESKPKSVSSEVHACKRIKLTCDTADTSA